MLKKLIVLSLLMLGPSTFARHLEGRTGFGITVHDFDYTPAISVRYHVSNYQSFQALVGFDTSDAKKSLVLGGKIYQNAHLEENMNFYVGIGGFLIADRGPDLNTSSGLELSGLLGGEFFLTGLPNLGFQFETGVALRTVRSVTFATIGNGFLGASAHYYF